MSPSPALPSGRVPLLHAALALCVVAAFLRLAAMDQPGLWGDEIFSLAMATGHSLEHAASAARPELGDYVEGRAPRAPEEYRRYLEHEHPPLGADRVIRAVRASDTSPPLYYLLLWGWTRIAGTNDAALRGMSILFALGCLPFLWLLATEIGGPDAPLPALLLFAVSPLAIYYSTEGRMYAMLWFLASALVWLSLRLHLGGGWRGGAGWVLVAAAGLLTHYFYAFVVLASAVWLLIHPGHFNRRATLIAGVVVGMLIAPWYVHIPESFSMWRVTKDWLTIPTVPSRAQAALAFPFTFVSPSNLWWEHYPRLDIIAAAVFGGVALAALWTLKHRLFAPRPQLIWLWLVLTCLGPYVFDRLLNTYTTAMPRYASAGMPAAFLLIALALTGFQTRWRAVTLLIVLLLWAPGTWRVITNQTRGGEAFRQVGSLLDARASPEDVVIVHSIPSGVTGVARYMHRPVPVFSWVGQLKQRRLPDDLETLDPRGRIILVKVHTVGEPAPEEEWLRAHATLVEEQPIEATHVLFFDLPPATARRGLATSARRGPIDSAAGAASGSAAAPCRGGSDFRVAC